MKVKVLVTLRRGVLDPQGKAVQSSLVRAGHGFVKAVRIGKSIELEIDDMPIESARVKVDEICEKLLANTVMEDYSVEFPQ